MLRSLVSALAVITVSGTSLVACVGTGSNDAPKLGVAMDDTRGQLLISLVRGPDHALGDLSATIGDMDLGAAETHAGTPGDASAVFRIARSEVPKSGPLHVEITEDGDTFVLEVPDWDAPRLVKPLGSIDALHAGDWIAATTGVASDRVSGGFTLDNAAGETCTVQWATDVQPSGVRLQVANNLATEAWWCGDVAPGTQRDAMLSLDLWATMAATCSGPGGVTCAPITAPALHFEQPVKVVF